MGTPGIEILLVEDSPGDARLVQWMLAQPGAVGFRVTEAERLGPAVELLGRRRFDAMLLDLSLPDSSGLETVRRARAAAGETPIVVMTGCDDEATALAALREGAQDYIVKGQADEKALARSLRYAIERERIEQALRRSEDRFRRFFDNNPEFCYMVAPDGSILDVNRSALAALGYRAEELVGRPIADIYAPESRPQGQALFERWVQGEHVESEETVILTRKGERLVVLMSAYVVRDDTGTVLHSVAVQRDITQRKLTEAALRRVNATLGAVIGAAPIAIVTLDREGRVTTWNRAAERIFGWTHDNAIGRLPPFVPAGRRDEFHRLHERVLAGEGIADVELVRQRRDGTCIEISLSAAPVLEPDGTALSIVGLIADITERKQRERELAAKTQELERLNELKNQFLGMAAHDLRNPLAVIVACSGFLLEPDADKLGEEKKREFLERIQANGEFMARLIEDLLDFTHIQSGRLELRRKPLDLAQVVATSVEQNRILAERRGVRLVLDPTPSLPRVSADPERVEQVLNNLLGNALKFSVSGASVELRADRQNGAVVVSVRDHGPGIPAGEQGKLFRPFSRTNVRAAGEKSTGLGLAICRSIVQAHGGRIWVESEPGQGATFSFSLPL